MIIVTSVNIQSGDVVDYTSYAINIRTVNFKGHNKTYTITENSITDVETIEEAEELHKGVEIYRTANPFIGNTSIGFLPDIIKQIILDSKINKLFE
jgi:hypothetical protein